MTDRLADLLHHEVQGLRVPPAPTAAVLAAGRRRRRRRRAAIGGGTAVACLTVTAVAVGVDAVPRHPHRDQAVSAPSHVATAFVGATFAERTTVYADDGRLRVTVPAPVVSLSYTSAGILVRMHGPGAGHDRYAVVTPDSRVRTLALTTRDVVPATDPAQPYLAYAEQRRGNLHVEVVDVRDGSTAADVEVVGAPSQPDGTPPGVAISGDTVWVGSPDATRVVDWRTGEVTSSTVVPPGFPYVRGGVTAARVDGRPAVVDAVSGERLLPLGDRSIGLSPDGRYASKQDSAEFGGGNAVLQVYDVSTGARTSVTVGLLQGWGPDDSLFSVAGDTVRTCSPTTGRCTATSLPEPIRVTGVVLGGVVAAS